MPTSDYIIYIFPSIETMLEALLLGFILALIFAAGYAYFVFSAQNDRADIIRKRLEASNPWEKMNKAPEKEPQKTRGQVIIKVVIISLAVIVGVLALLLLAVRMRWM